LSQSPPRSVIRRRPRLRLRSPRISRPFQPLACRARNSGTHPAAMSGAALLATAAAARRGVPSWERRAYSAIYDLPNSLAPHAWLPMQFGSLASPFVLGGIAYRRNRRATPSGSSAAWLYEINPSQLGASAVSIRCELYASGLTGDFRASRVSGHTSGVSPDTCDATTRRERAPP
jgi:hypothetical protein